MKPKRILMASFFGFVPEYIYPEYAVMGGLIGQDYELDVLRTGNGSIAVPGLSMIHVDPISYEPSQILNNLFYFEKKLERIYPEFNYIDINSILTRDDTDEVENFIDGLSLELDLSGYDKIHYRGVELGRGAIFSTLRGLQLESFEHIEQRVVDQYIVNLKAGALAICLAHRLSEHNRWDVLIISQYAYTCSLCFHWALEKTSKVRLISPSSPTVMGGTLELRRFRLRNDLSMTRKIFNVWNSIKKLPRCNYSRVSSHFECLFEGRSVEGSTAPVSTIKTDLYDLWGLDKTKKLILATLNSPDETFAMECVWGQSSEKLLFETQFQWIEKLIDFFDGKDDVYLIIRAHPRMLNKKLNLKTTFLEILMDKFKTLPSNIILNLPHEDVSIHDIMKYCSLLLVTASSSVFEFGLFGIPSIAIMHDYDGHPLEDISKIPDTQDDYFKCISDYLERPSSIEPSNIMISFRWLKYAYGDQLLDLSPILRFKKHKWPAWWLKLDRIRSKIQSAFAKENMPFDPVWIERKLPCKELNLLSEMIDENIDFFEAKLRSSEHPKPLDEIDEMVSILDKLVRIIYGFPVEKKIGFTHEGSSNESFLTFSPDVGIEGQVYQISSHHWLLNQLAPILFGNIEERRNFFQLPTGN